LRKVVLQEFVTLNALAAGPSDNVDFIPESTSGDRAFGREQMALFDAIDTIVLGRVTYQMFAGYWPYVTEPDEKPFADKMNATPKIVFSQTLDRAPWGTFDEARIVRTPAAQEIASLKRQPGRDIVIWGSISLAQSLIGDRLIDEFRLVICPRALASGRPLFGDGVGAMKMTLLGTKSFDLGAVSLTYVSDDVPSH
jgi:dihydrofolate reductase